MIGTLLYPFWELRNTAARNGNILQNHAELASFGSGTLAELLTLRGKSFHFSMVTFATVGYGDLQPVGWAQTVATVESFTGGLLMAFLVFVLGRQLTW